MTIADLFIDDEGRVRSGWRFAIFVAGFVLLAGTLLFCSSVLLASVAVAGASATLWSTILFNLSFLVPAILLGWLCTRFLDRLHFSSLGVSFTAGWIRNLAIGIATGALTLCLAVLIAYLFGGLSFTSDPLDWTSIGHTLALSFVVFVVAAASEEALFRGYPMQTFFHSRLTLFGIFFMAVLFATTHVQNPSADLLSWINTFLAGIWFAVAFWKTGDLWFPFGMHLMWNWMQGAFFGIEVSGLTDITSAPLLKEIDRGPAWLTGETYGIEAGVACTIAIIISTIAIYLWPQKSRENKP